MGDVDKIERRLEQAYADLLAFGLPSSEVQEGLQTKGGLRLNPNFHYRRDSYIRYKSPSGDAVGLALLQEAEDSVPYLVLRRQQTVGRAMPDVSIDRLRVEDLELAVKLFLATSELIGRVPNSLREAYPPST